MQVCGVTTVTVGVLMYASADTGGNSSFYWRLLDGLPMIGPLPTETHTRRHTSSTCCP